MGCPKRLRARVAVVVGEAVGERGGWTVVRSRVAVEPRQNVARRRAAQPRERREGDEPREREQDDAGDAEGARRELPDAEPRGGEKQDDDRDRNDERRPGALDHQRAPRQSRERAEPGAFFGVAADWQFFRVAHRDAINP